MRRLLLLVIALVASCNIAASSNTETISDEAYKKLVKTLPGIPKEDIRTTPINGIYEVRRGTDFGYVSADGRYLIHGDLVDLSTGKQLTEQRRMKARLDRIEKVGDDKMIGFDPPAPQQAKYEVTV